MSPTVPPLHRRQRGSALIEALVAFLVLSIGMVLVAKMQSHLRLHSDLARQRTEAVRLAQREMETLRAFSTVAATVGAHSFAAISTAPASTDAQGFTLQRNVDVDTWAHAKAVSIRVGWTDRAGGAQEIVLNSIIDGGDPAVSGALGLAPGATTPVSASTPNPEPAAPAGADPG